MSQPANAHPDRLPPRDDVAGRVAAEEHADPFDWGLLFCWIGFVLRAPRRHRLVAAGAFTAVLALAIALVLVMPYRYVVQSVVLVRGTPIMISISNPGMNREADLPTLAAREVVTSRENLLALCKKVNFVERYLAGRAPIVRLKDWIIRSITRKERDRRRLLDSIVRTLQGRLWIATGGEGTVTTTFEWSDPVLARDVVEAAQQTFLGARHVTEVEAVGETIEILERHDARVREQIATTVAQVEEKERPLRVRSGRRRAPVVLPPVVDGGEDLASLESKLAARRRALADLEGGRQQRLIELQAQLAQQETIYAPNHPSVTSTREVIESLSQPSPQILALRAETQDLEVEARSRRAAATAPRAHASQMDFAETRRILQLEDPRMELERRQLEDLLRQHADLLQRIDGARVEMDTAEAAFKYRYIMVSPAQLPTGPAKPYTLMYLVGGILGGVAMALFAATTADLLGGRVLERWQVEKGLGLPVLGEVAR